MNQTGADTARISSSTGAPLHVSAREPAARTVPARLCSRVGPGVRLFHGFGFCGLRFRHLAFRDRCSRRPRRGGRALLGVLVLSALLLAGCDSGERGFLRELLRIEGASTYGGEEPSQERIEELKQEIEEYRSIVEEKVEAAGQLGTYHKMLGLAYMDERMFGLALDHLEQAISIQPENAILLYHAGVCSAQTAKSTVDEQERRRLLRDAEQYYLRSIELDPERNDANYALGVLYTFELDEPAEARPYLQQMIEDEPKNERAYMVLARSFAATGNVDRAVELYDQAAEVASNDEVRQAALRNREALVEGQGQ